MSDVLASETVEALRALRAEMYGDPFDPARDVTLTAAAEALGLTRKAAQVRLEAAGWQSRTTQLPNGKRGLAFRRPD